MARVARKEQETAKVARKSGRCPSPQPSPRERGEGDVRPLPASEARGAVRPLPVGGTKGPTGVKIVEGKEVALDASTIRKVMEGWEAKKTLDDAKARLDAINAELIEAHGAGCALVVTGICRASLTARETVKITDADRLEAVLGERIGDLVRIETHYRPEPRLIEMACDGDEPLQPAIGACLTVSQSQSVTWRAEY